METNLPKILILFCILALVAGPVAFFAYAVYAPVTVLSPSQRQMSAEDILENLQTTDEYKNSNVQGRNALLRDIFFKMRMAGKVVSYSEDESGLFSYFLSDYIDEQYVAANETILEKNKPSYMAVYHQHYKPLFDWNAPLVRGSLSALPAVVFSVAIAVCLLLSGVKRFKRHDSKGVDK